MGDNTLSMGLLGLNGLFTLYSASVANDVKYCPIKGCNDSTAISYIILLTVLVASFEVAISFLIQDAKIFLIFLLAGITLAAWATIGLMFGPNFYVIIFDIKEPEPGPDLVTNQT